MRREQRDEIMLIKLLYSGVSDGRKSAGDASGSAGKCAEVESNLHIETRNEKSRPHMQPGHDSATHIFQREHCVKFIMTVKCIWVELQCKVPSYQPTPALKSSLKNKAHDHSIWDGCCRRATESARLCSALRTENNSRTARNSECQGERKMMKCVPSFFSRIFKNSQSVAGKTKLVKV